MKIMKKIVVWAMLSIMLQATVLMYIDKVYFKHSSDFVLTEVKDTETSVNTEIAIPEGVENLKVSYDGRYATYNLGKSFYLVDMNEGKIDEVITDDKKTEVLCSEWLLDSNRIAIAEKIVNDNGAVVIRVINYNTKSNSFNVVKEICSYSESMKVDNIQTNTRSGVTYVSVSKNGHYPNIYRIDINNNIKNLGVKVYTLGGIKVFPHKDVLIYEDKMNKKFYDYTNGNISDMDFANSDNLELLSVDNNNKVYMGELVDGKIKTVKIGTLDTNISTWECIELEKEKDVNDIYINNLGEIIINDKLEGKITNLSTQDIVEYKGKNVGFNNKIVASVDNGKLYISSLKK